MATRLPPPKRIKTYHGAPEPEPETPLPSPNIVVQFVSEEDGQSLAPAVNLPANTTREGLEVLLNKLSTKDEDPVPFQFHVALPEGPDTKPGAPTRIVIQKSLEADVLGHSSDAFSAEDVFVVYCAPQSVFRVRPATRCSSTLSGHTSPILCASFSPTGNLLATGSGDTHARLWDLNTETPSHVLAGHVGWVLCVEWEALERKLATGGHDGHVRLWDPKSGKPIGEAMKGHSKWITSLTWEPIHINPSSPRVASSSKDGTVRVWSTLTRRTEFTLSGHSASVNVVKWGGAGGPKGVLYTASSDRTVRIWDGETVTQELAKARYDKLLATTPELLISGSDDHTLFLWSPFGSNASQKPVARLTGHQRQVSHVAFSPDGRWAASAGWDGSVRAVYRLAWSADGRLLVSASKDSTLKIWDLKTYKIKTDLPGHTDEVYCVDFVADKVVSGGRDRTLKIWKN
ncbi:hypothetical protein H0H87_003959 [Tephrocybe sp. NHM501043]|nr:hypothetical protein H0H87_003959 [Tephrocybe sp. NHM501043]